MISIVKYALRSASFLLLLASVGKAQEVRPGVTYSGPLDPVGTERAIMQNIIFDFAAAWTTCESELETTRSESSGLRMP